MKPDSLEWWYQQAQQAREQIREDPTPESCCFYALAAGRCRLLGKTTKWPFPVKKAVGASECLVNIIDDFKSHLTDIHWLVKLWPEKIKDITPTFISRRIDILGVQVMLDHAFEEIDSRYENLVNETTDNVVNALLDLDVELEKAMPYLRSMGNGDKILEYHRSRIAKQFHDQWWLSETVKDKAK